MEAVECGAAALAMVLAYHGRNVPLEDCAPNAVSHATQQGQQHRPSRRANTASTQGLQKEPENSRSYHVPMIVHWNFNHFLVLEGFKDGRAYLNDPAAVRRPSPTRNSTQAYTGITLVFQKTAAFTRGGESAACGTVAASPPATGRARRCCMRCSRESPSSFRPRRADIPTRVRRRRAREGMSDWVQAAALRDGGRRDRQRDARVAATAPPAAIRDQARGSTTRADSSGTSSVAG